MSGKIRATTRTGNLCRNSVDLRSRDDNDFSLRYRSIAKALSALPNETVVDGEVVALDKEGKPSFN